MLTLKQNRITNNGINIIGYFHSVEEIYDKLVEVYGKYSGYSLYQRFSHDLNDKYWLENRYCYSWDDTRQLIPFEYCYVIENDKGIRYSQETVRGLFTSIRKRRKLIGSYHNWYGYKHNSRGGVSIKTTQEKRMIATINHDEGEPDFRGKRKHLPSNWQREFRDDQDDRNWKRYRKTQYK